VLYRIDSKGLMARENPDLGLIEACVLNLLLQAEQAMLDRLLGAALRSWGSATLATSRSRPTAARTPTRSPERTRWASSVASSLHDVLSASLNTTVPSRSSIARTNDQRSAVDRSALAYVGAPPTV
jgi:hypothetical protein